jgi:hypothetical protein
MLTTYTVRLLDDHKKVRQGIELGKTQNLTELVTAIRTVAQGRIYLKPCRCPKYEIESGAFNSVANERLSKTQGAGSVEVFSRWYDGKFNCCEVFA